MDALPNSLISFYFPGLYCYLGDYIAHKVIHNINIKYTIQTCLTWIPEIWLLMMFCPLTWFILPFNLFFILNSECHQVYMNIV